MMKLNREACFSGCSIYLILLIVVASSVLAQVNAYGPSTSIADLRYPEKVLLGASNQRVQVDFTVSYSGASSGYYLGFSVFDVDKQTPLAYYYARGSGRSSPDPCTTSTDGDAFCYLRLTKSSGMEHVTFYLDLYQPQYYRLQASAMMGSSLTNPLYDTRSLVYFSIQVRNKVQLTVRAPYQVSVIVDGMKQSQGNVFLDVYPGNHQISVPETVDVTNMTRLRFVHWADGKAETTRTEDLQDDVTLEAVFVEQYLLTLMTAYGSPTGSGWYDKGSSAEFSISNTHPMDGILGILGGKWKFQGWYENGNSISSNEGTVTMNEAHSLTGMWEADYTIPIAIVGVALATGIATGIAIRRQRTRQTTALDKSMMSSAQAELSQVYPEFVRAEIEPTRVQAREALSKFCRECGARIPVSSKFCEKCGTKLV